MKRFVSLSLAILLMLAFAPAARQAGDVEIIIHYQRADGDYEKWNIWSWAAGKDGAAYPFNGTDDFGMVAAFTIPNAETSVGFIVRTDSWEKDVPADRYIDLTLGNEIWVYTGEPEFFYNPPEGYGDMVEYDELELIIHRHRYDGAYEREDAQIESPYVEKNVSPYQEAALVGEDDFGIVYHLTLNNVNSRQRYQLLFAIDGRGMGYAEYFDLALSKVPEGEKTLVVYAVQGWRTLQYGEMPVIETAVRGATIEGPDLVSVTLSYPVKVTGGLEGFRLTDSGSREVALSSVTRLNPPDAEADVNSLTDADYDNAFLLETAEPVDLSEVYTVSKDGYEEKTAAIGVTLFGSEGFEQMYTYDGALGALYGKDKTTFRLWAPTAIEARVNLYPAGNGSDPSETLEMKRLEKGVWEAEKAGDLKNTYYTYTVNVNGAENEAVDPYAKAAGVNGLRGMVVDLEATNPSGWEEDKAPPFLHPTDAVLYELHVRDFSIAKNSGMANKGKYLAFTETGTKNDEGLATGIDHLAEMGVTHVHLLPVFDFRTVDESKLNVPQFNWGYDPENYNIPEGSYSTDPYDGNVRITEFKQMVQSLHSNGIRVVMDVVYNHTSRSSDSNLNLLVPNYYYRMNDAGGFANGSACGNETASERSMVRKFIIDSVVYWATEYNIDGFRFDLMALHDIETMNAVRAALDEIDPSILLYGEGWHAGGTPLPEELQANKANTGLLDERIAAFSDDIRDGIKGHVFQEENPGFINGNHNEWRENVKFGITGSVFHPQVDYSKLRDGYASAPWAKAPSQTITYASAHDNLTLWDKFKASRPDLREDEWLRMNKLSALLVFTSQGIPFFQAGEEFARTKYGEHNSYESPDAINQLDWKRKSNYNDLVEYYKGLIELRKARPSFRLQTADEIAAAISFLPTEQQVLAYTLDTPDGPMVVAVNADSVERSLSLPMAGWDILVDGNHAGTGTIGRVEGDTLIMPALTGFVLAQRTGDGSALPETSPEAGNGDSQEEGGGRGLWPIVLGIVGIVLAGGAAVWVFLRRKNK
ncbi:MAG: type I pullulanase [Oscillospiraceae bacterium]|jgi:pullulanase|nr:type I pullulanase [Oscillospiraceae bacterium]